MSKLMASDMDLLAIVLLMVDYVSVICWAKSVPSVWQKFQKSISAEVSQKLSCSL